MVSALFFALLCFQASAQPPLVTVFEYIDTYAPLCVEQMVEYRIPASVILAQAIVESSSGTSELARKSNNHFGIKCHTSWDGDTSVKTDDVADECFRKYSSIRESYLDHSRFLSSRARYSHLFSLPVTDYKSWCQGLKEAGYATFPGYAEQLIRTIERYRLYEFDGVQRLMQLLPPQRVPTLRKSALAGAVFPLSEFAKHGLFWLDEKEIHVRSLDMLLESEQAEDLRYAGK